MTLYGGKSLDQIDALMLAASDLPWRTNEHEQVVIPWGRKSQAEYAVLLQDEDYGNQSADAKYIVAAVNAIPALIARVRELESNIHQLCIDQQKQLDARDKRIARLRDVLNWTNDNCPLECRAKTGAALEQDEKP